MHIRSFYFSNLNLKIKYLGLFHLKMSQDIGGMRIPYKDHGDSFMEDDLVAKEPISQFKNWFEAACQLPEIQEPNAMCLATATREGKPSARMVLLKGYGKDGFIFYTNYDSRKGKELAENPCAALNFFWEPMRRSVRIEGIIEKIPQEDSSSYFVTRPRNSQIAASISPQSQPILNREELTEKFNKMEKEYSDPNVQIQKPPNWGGFRLIPQVIEFWQGQTSRLHDRIRFKLGSKSSEFTHQGDDGWVYERLAP